MENENIHVYATYVQCKPDTDRQNNISLGVTGHLVYMEIKCLAVVPKFNWLCASSSVLALDSGNSKPGKNRTITHHI